MLNAVKMQFSANTTPPWIYAQVPDEYICKETPLVLKNWKLKGEPFSHSHGWLGFFRCNPIQNGEVEWEVACKTKFRSSVVLICSNWASKDRQFSRLFFPVKGPMEEVTVFFMPDPVLWTRTWRVCSSLQGFLKILILLQKLLLLFGFLV